MVRQPRRNRVPRSAVLAAATVSLLALTAGLNGSASAATTTPQVRHTTGACEVYKDLVETNVTRSYGDVPPAGLSVGDVGHYVNEIRDAAGAYFGTVHGTVRMIYADPTTGHVIGNYDEKITFANGGRIHTLGVADINNMLGGGASVIGAVGTGGRYRGFHGTREWDFKTRDVVIDTFRLCPDHD